MTATRTLHLLIAAVLVVAALTAAVLLASPVDRPAGGADPAICEPGEPRPGCYPAEA
ncbi:hypothetical protein [Geodermatophilus sp. SYSU D00700]